MLQLDPTADTVHVEKELAAEFVHLRSEEESFLRQKSSNQWLNLGDQNSRFFFQKVK